MYRPLSLGYTPFGPLYSVLNTLMQVCSSLNIYQSGAFEVGYKYLYCSACIRPGLGVSKDRLCRQCNIKRLQSQVPIVEMTKSEAEKKRLGDYVLIPAHLDLSFNKWWRSQEPDTDSS